MKIKENLGYVCTGVSAILTALQDNAIYQVVNMILVILSLLINIIYTIYKWYKQAGQDGRIDIDEVGDLLDGVKNELDNSPLTKKEEEKHEKD